MMVNPIEIDYIDYEKITDDLYIIGQNLILRFNVSLAKKMNNGDRYHFHHVTTGSKKCPLQQTPAPRSKLVFRWF